MELRQYMHLGKILYGIEQKDFLGLVMVDI